MTVTGEVTIPAPHGQLEGIYRPARGPERASPGAAAAAPSEPRLVAPSPGCALVLHPHPLYGGTMHNKVVFHLARALGELGMSTLRVNFRGVGRSTGTHDQGRGEVIDARTALDWLLARERNAARVVLAGFSFGAAIALQLARGERRIDRLVAVGTPARALDEATLAAELPETLFVHGADDDVAPLAELRGLLERHPDPKRRLVVLPRTGHFFEESLDALRNAVSDFLR